MRRTQRIARPADPRSRPRTLRAGTPPIARRRRSGRIRPPIR
ncbi:hypothetical protein BDSB_03780 [Burkholderia dolosa PC543]|nr:hypothetical protein BDSB_03780 [Burkholderia dolosa PC543]